MEERKRGDIVRVLFLSRGLQTYYTHSEAKGSGIESPPSNQTSEYIFRRITDYWGREEDSIHLIIDAAHGRPNEGTEQLIGAIAFFHLFAFIFFFLVPTCVVGIWDAGKRNRPPRNGR